MSALMLAVVLLAGSNPLVLEHLVIDAPEGWTLQSQFGPDFSVFNLRPPEGSLSRIGVYLGNHPSPLAASGTTRSEPFMLGKKEARWSLWREVKEGVTHLHAELLLKRPFGTEPGGSDSLHIFVSATSAADLAAVQDLARSLHPR